MTTEHPEDFARRVERVHHEFARLAEHCPHRGERDPTYCYAGITAIALCGIGACPVLMLGETESDR